MSTVLSLCNILKRPCIRYQHVGGNCDQQFQGSIILQSDDRDGSSFRNSDTCLLISLASSLGRRFFFRQII